MPPKQRPSKLIPQGSTIASSQFLPKCRQPVQTPNLPSVETIPPLWTSASTPMDVFPEWTDPATLSLEHWGTAEDPFEDTLAPEKLLVPWEAMDLKEMIVWKRPCQFLPAIVDAPPPPASEPKSKKGDPALVKRLEPKPLKKLDLPKYAHVFHPRVENADDCFSKLPSLAIAAGVNHAKNHALQIPRDFQRRWSAEQAELLQAWAKEEERIDRERQHRERIYMNFEDAIANIINSRPQDIFAEVDFDVNDLVDNGEDEDDTFTTDESNATSPWGVTPPPRIEIAPNAISKPDFPHGEIIHGDMASYFRIVEQLYYARQESYSGSAASFPPFLWQAIYPQDSTKQPIYNPGGKYSVKLFVFGRWRRVDIDDKLPLDAHGNFVYLSSSMKNEVWPCLLVKALYKVVFWLNPNFRDHQHNKDAACETVIQIILSLTSWKVSRWGLDANVINSENRLHELLQFVPTSENGGLAKENVDEIGSTLEASEIGTETSTKPKITPSDVPLVLVCCTGVDKAVEMVFGEVVLVTNIVGDTGNTTFTVLRQGFSTTMLKKETEHEFLLVHSAYRFSECFSQTWIPNSDLPVDCVENSPATLIPFDFPGVRFLVVTTDEPVTPNTPNDSTYKNQVPVKFIATLTPVHPPRKPDEGLGSLRKSSKLMAAYLGVDPKGSMVLIEEKKNMPRFLMPAVVTLNSTLPELVSLPLVDECDLVFRIYPQKSLRYGYNLEIESDHKVAFLDAPTYWRSLADMHVVECDGSYPVMLPGTWNILFKQSFELVPSSRKSRSETLLSFLELRVDLHLCEELLANFTHITVVNDATGEVNKFSTLCSKLSLPATFNSAGNNEHSTTAYTVIVDCSPQNLYIREGKWKLTLASDWEITKSMTHEMKMTRFEGIYEPNKPLLCFRDVIIAPKSSYRTTFQLQFLNGGGKIDNLAAKLEVFDLANENISQISAASYTGEARLLQLPLIADSGQPIAADKRGYIIQGSIDRSACVVPDGLQSLRPFRYNSTVCSTLPKQDVTTCVGENAPSVGPQEGGNGVSPVDVARRCEVKWRLNCWSSDEVKLQEDNSKELQDRYNQASWAEMALERKNNGIVSRLVYLGKVDEVEAKMKLDNMTDEQIAKARGRFDWVHGAKKKSVGDSYLEIAGASDENLLTEQDVADRKRVLFERIGLFQADREQRCLTRAHTKEKRAKEMKNDIRYVVDKRATFLKRQQELKRMLTAMQPIDSSKAL